MFLGLTPQLVSINNIYINIFQRLKVDEDERSIVIDLQPYMSSAPYIVRLVSTYLVVCSIFIIIKIK